MKLKLSQIQPSPNPIRKTWDETKMEELKWSLMEEGQVEPIGVHENSHGYRIVWGHRRVEAARRAGWDDIEAVVVPEDEVDNLIQAGIENLSGEDMKIDDKVEWVRRLLDLGLSQVEISRRSTVPAGTISLWLTYGRERAAGIFIKTPTKREGDSDWTKIAHVAGILGNDLQSKQSVIDKVSEEGLTVPQARSVAEAYRDAPTPAVKAQVLKTPIVSRDTAADILRRSVNRVEMETGVASLHEMNDWDREREERRTYQDFDMAVKEFLDSARLFLEVARKGSALVKYGKYSPEAARFAIRKIDSLIDALKTYKEELENVK